MSATAQESLRFSCERKDWCRFLKTLAITRRIPMGQYQRLMNKLTAVSLLFVVSQTVHAANWVHILRYEDPKLMPVDPAPYDEYLDTEFVGHEGKWTFIHIKTISDEDANEYHGKMELITLAISCREYKLGQKNFRAYFDKKGLRIKRSQTNSAADLERFARAIQPFEHETVGTLYYVHACLGITPEMWKNRQKPAK